jgi:DNA-binding NarL/FixJ family response regulator
MTNHILIIDSDQAFATALQEELHTQAGLEVRIAASGDAARQALERDDVDLAILDMGVDSDEFDDDGTCLQKTLALMRELRTVKPGVRLMVIPLMGQDVPSEVTKLNIQGTLSKPFFLDDLLPRLQRALTLPPPGSQPAAGASPSRPEPESVVVPATGPAGSARPGVESPQPATYAQTEPIDSKAIRQALFELVRETGADAAIFVGPASLVVKEGILDRGRAQALAQQVRRALETSRHVSQFLEGASKPLAHQILEGAGTRLYIQALSPLHALAVLTPLQTPLGVVRVNMQRTGRVLQAEIEASL